MTSLQNTVLQRARLREAVRPVVASRIEGVTRMQVIDGYTTGLM